MRFIYITPDDYYWSGVLGTKLYLTQSQKDLIDRCILGYKIIYNWAIKCERDNYDLSKAGLSKRSFLRFYTLESMYKDFRDNDHEFGPLLRTLPTHSMRNALIDVVHGYELFFQKVNINPPNYKYDSKFQAFSSYRVRSDATFYF